jgi:lysophospholipase L1-like esterase
MNNVKTALLAAALSGFSLFATRAAAAPENPFFLKEGDRVVFYGDSITEQSFWGAGAYADFTETYVLTRFPGLHVDFTNSGWGGDAVSWSGGGPVDVRVQRDIVAHQPTVVTIMLGMNDGKYRAFDQDTFNTYRDGYRRIVATVRKDLPGVRLTFIEPSPFDDFTRPPVFEGGYNAVLLRYGDFVKELAAQNQQAVTDFNSPVVAMLRKARAEDPALAQKIINDRVHPGPGAHLLMAEALLRGWNAPSLVTEVEIDAAKRVAVTALGTQVTGLAAGGPIEWTQADSSLPMPIDLSDPATALAVRNSDFIDSLDREVLRVTGLAGTSPSYALKIDGGKAGDFSPEQLAAGINLATLPTPMARQAAEVHKLTERRNHIRFTRWHWVEVSLAQDGRTDAIDAAVPPLLKALDDEEAGVAAQQRAKTQPVPHQYVLEPEGAPSR